MICPWTNRNCTIRGGCVYPCRPDPRNRIMDRARQRARNNPIDMPAVTRGDVVTAIVVAFIVMSIALAGLSAVGEIVQAVR